MSIRNRTAAAPVLPPTLAVASIELTPIPEPASAPVAAAPQPASATPPSPFKTIERKGDGFYLFNDELLRSIREADDKSGFACFYGNTAGEDALYRGKLPTAERASAWLAGDDREVPAE